MSPSTKDLSHGLRLEFFSYKKWRARNKPRVRFFSDWGYLHEVHSHNYMAAMLDLVCKDIGQKAADLYTVQKLLDNRKDFTGCKN